MSSLQRTIIRLACPDENSLIDLNNNFFTVSNFSRSSDFHQDIHCRLHHVIAYYIPTLNLENETRGISEPV